MEQERDPFGRTYAWLLLAVACLGLFLRALGYFDGSNGLWWDEAAWVREISEGQYGIRPIGYALVSRVLIALHPSEVVVRAPSLVLGVLTVPVFAFVALRAGLSRAAALFGMVLLALHPWAIAYSKEFKPYAAELFAHALLLGGSVEYLRSRKTSSLVLLGALVPVACVLSWTAAAILPGLLLVLVLEQWRKRARMQLAITGGATLLGAIVLGLVYVTRVHGRNVGTKFWAKKYGVFSTDPDLTDRLGWTIDKTIEVARFPFELHSISLVPTIWSQVLGFVGLGLVVLGIAALVRRRSLPLALLFVAPWFVVVATNWIGLWPYGVFRTNLFLLVYPLLLAALGFDELERHWIPRFGGRTRPLLAPTLAAVLVAPALAPDLDYFRTKDRATGAESTAWPQVFELLAARAKTRPPGATRESLVLDAHACGAFSYYTKLHPERAHLPRRVARQYRVICSRLEPENFRRWVARSARKDSWVFVSKQTLRDLAREEMGARCATTSEEIFPTTDVLIRCTGKRKKPVQGSDPGVEVPAAPDESSEKDADEGLEPPPSTETSALPDSPGSAL